ncbi:MAG TPA: hypothetical protein ENI23_17940 [bacterium]|nr:hypothetical protein [bacterium]
MIIVKKDWKWFFNTQCRGHEYDVIISDMCLQCEETGDYFSPYQAQTRECAECGIAPTEKGHDACIANLPNVKNACCGHGKRGLGYIQFEDEVLPTLYFPDGLKGKIYMDAGEAIAREISNA